MWQITVVHGWMKKIENLNSYCLTNAFFLYRKIVDVYVLTIRLHFGGAYLL